MKILGLDISSSTIGYALIEDLNLIKTGHIKPPDKKKSLDNFSLRLDFAYSHIKDLIKKLNPDIIVAEEYAKKFSQGKSSANTIIVLSTFNEVCCLAAYQETKQQVIKIPVTTLRKIISKKYDVNMDDKEDVLSFCKKNFSYKDSLNKNLNIKKECYDETDALIVALGYYWSNNG